MNESDHFPPSAGLHYGWIILGAGVGVMFACLGLGRFALGMLLPAMGEALQLDYGQMGLISTANFVGYMVSVIFAGRISNKFGPRLVISSGLGITGISMALIFYVGGLKAILVLYFITGMVSSKIALCASPEETANNPNKTISRIVLTLYIIGELRFFILSQMPL